MPYKVDTLAFQLVSDQGRVALTETEARVATYLYQRRGRVVSQRELMAAVWNDPNPLDTTVVRMTVASIRRKGGDQVIATRHRLGYMWGEYFEDSQ